MNKRYNERLGKVLRSVLEGFAMVFTEEEAQSGVKPEFEGFVTAKIMFTGDGRGTIILALPGKFCGILAANVLGVDPDDEQARSNRDDAVKEMINITAGHFVREEFGEKAVFDLLPPEIGPAAPSEVEELINSADTSLMAEGYQVIAAAAVESAG